MPLFPLVGLGIGISAGVVAFSLSQLLPPLIVGLLTLGALLLLTGLHHTDGLLDFGDGLMCKGSREQKIGAMRDTVTGVGGHSLGLVILLTTAFAISSFQPSEALSTVAVSETAAKASMVLAAGVGKSASPGLNTPFIDAMHGRLRALRVFVPLATVLVVGFSWTGYAGVASAIAGFLATLLLVRISAGHFGGLTGDVFGAINEIARLAALVTFLGALRWR